MNKLLTYFLIIVVILALAQALTIVSGNNLTARVTQSDLTQAKEINCFDNLDDDRDTFIDCNDLDCANTCLRH